MPASLPDLPLFAVAPTPVPTRPLPDATPFLARIARELVAQYGPTGELSDLVVVVPTRRAVVYLQNELSLAAETGQAVWSPRVAAMEDYMVELAGVRVEEPIALQLLLFEILQDIDPQLDFDQFVGWSNLLLQDFSSLDQNLASPRKVFEYLSQAKALERWDLGAEYQPLDSTTAYFRFWDDLDKVYFRIKKRMRRDHLAYPGLAYRLAQRRVRERLEADEELPRHVFVGLGFLSKAEERLIRHLRKAGRAEVYFDGDAFYLEPGSPNRAGQHLRQYKERLDLPWENFGGPAELLRQLPRTVRMVGVANSSMQGKVAGQLLAAARQANPNAKVAVVLPDETLLLPVLHGLPLREVPEYNVTMGLNFQSTPLFNLVDLLFEVHLTGVREGSQETGYGVPRYHHLAVSKLLQHPFLRRYQGWLDKQDDPAGHGMLDKVCRAIVQRHAVLLPAEELVELGQGHPLLEALFATWNNCDDIIAACNTLIDLLKKAYQDQHSAIEAEYLYLFYTLVKRLHSVFDCREQRLSVRSFRRFLYEQMRNTRLPFSGEPIADVQVMGLLETRALDFDHVIILSCNENVLPAPKRHSSLFPYDVLTTFGLPTYADHEAATAHQFWRLLQRTRNVDLLHILPGAEGTRTGERSRFLLQLENDLALQNPALELLDLTVSTSIQAGASPPGPLSEKGQGELASSSFSSSKKLKASSPSPFSERGRGGEAPVSTDLTLEKDAGMLLALRELLTKGLSPTALNQYLGCSLQFYFQRIAKFKENQEVEEVLDSAEFGTAVHDALEELLTPFAQIIRRKSVAATAPPLTASDIPGLVALAPIMVAKALRKEEAGRHARADEGLNHVLGQVAKRLVRRYLESLLETEGALPLHIQGLEEELHATVFVALVEGEKLAVRLLGKADRVDQLPNGDLRVVDYKTGLVEKSQLQLLKRNEAPEMAIDRLLTDATPSADKVRQLWLYRFMLAQQGRPAADAAIISLRNLAAGPMSADMSFLTADGQDFNRHSEELLGQLVRRILDPAEPIRKTDDLDKCQYCAYRGICAR
ncbi:PD-(D/E)XK nuclease family protein [Hymenobacter psychrophilus]|uniref:PD-(D/E)XK nuclease superfamily protein n=1 Tax=Hymenobacter psychrophilus TaxID=651662 RepID=A0A1H3BW69_9BACT|nr:PD-(D/E)XK nuclease family protein [Hymenobacter psychrophilus]SDX46167.1 PD-(D/E)XK nuclease superfamily protein [Hymenobacter psychrophilus]